VITLWTRNRPKLLRMNIRSLRRYVPYLRGLVKSRKVGVRIGRGVKLTGPGEYRLHRGCQISDGVRIFVGPGAVLEMMPRSRLGDRSIVNAATRVTIGRGTEVSWDVQILDTDFHEIVRLDGSVGRMSRSVLLEDNVLVGTGAFILKGVTVGTGSIVGAGSVVTQDVPPGTVVAGNPAKVVAGTKGWR